MFKSHADVQASKIETSSQAPSYASPKLWLTYSLTRSLTGVRCRATSVAKKDISIPLKLKKLSKYCLHKTSYSKTMLHCFIFDIVIKTFHIVCIGIHTEPYWWSGGHRVVILHKYHLEWEALWIHLLNNFLVSIYFVIPFHCSFEQSIDFKIVEVINNSCYDWGVDSNQSFWLSWIGQRFC